MYPASQSSAKLEAYVKRLTELSNPVVSSRHENRDPGRPPTESEDPFNAVIRFCDVRGSDSGPLVGKRFGIKDSIPVAGIPITYGKRLLSPPVPSEDAVVIERILDAGASIVAMTNISEGRGNAAFGDTSNPLNSNYSPGFSSSGSAAAVACGLVDAALGKDGAGSVRIPAAWCGLVGMKPSRGLVPLHGVANTSSIGPITRTVAENASILQVLSGMDWRDPLAVYPKLPTPDFDLFSERALDGLRIGVVAESLEASNCTNGTLQAFSRSQKKLADLGATIQDASISLWVDLPAIFWPISIARNSLAPKTDFAMTTSENYRSIFPNHRFDNCCERDSGLLFAKAQNIALKLRKDIDDLLEGFDFLITPTTPTGPYKLQTATQAASSYACDDKQRYLHDYFVETAVTNTYAFNLTGHPALTIPAGNGDNDLPVGLQMIGRMFDDMNIYKVGHAFELAS